MSDEVQSSPEGLSNLMHEDRRFPPPEGLAAGTFGTALPIAVAARWLAEGRVPPGVHPPETAFDAGAFLQALVAGGVEAWTKLEERFPKEVRSDG